MSDASPSSSSPETAPFLLEIGVEELPYASVAPAIEQFLAGLLARLSDERLGVDASAVRTYGTPRRLVFVVPGVPLRQPDAEQEVRGPSVKAAYGPDGAPTKAAEGFAAKNGVPVTSLTVEGDYVIARKTVIGRPAAEVLGQAIPELLRTVTFGKFMRWGEGNYRFGRPLRRFVALLGGEVVPFTVEGVTSGNATVGHRFLHPEPVVIESSEQYVDALRAAYVEVEPTMRREQIIEQANKLAESIGGKVVFTDALIDENVYLTEWVTAVLGSFDRQYLELPRPVLETAMKKHQRFFPVEGPDGNLLPNFIAIRSGDDAHVDTVRAGYENVLGSRFNDAKFFYDHDRQSPLADKVVRTERIVFQEKLGTLADKTKRLDTILHDAHLYSWTHDGEHARRAVHLAKADLASEIVMELPALQGVMGREFARLDGEHSHVAEALLEQYLPRSAGDALPKSRIGSALALADRTDTLVGYMRFVGAEPKGSSDPFGLKRAASAIVDLLARDRALPTVSSLLAAAEKAYIAQGLTPAAKPGDLMALMEQRLRGLLEERSIRHDLIDALLAAPWDNIASVVKRGDVLTALLPTAEEFTVATAATRVRNILRGVKEELPPKPNRADFTTKEETILFSFAAATLPDVEKVLDNGEYVDAIDRLAALTSPIGKLFDNVMVMDEDPVKRTARLALLAMLDRVYLRLADFSKLNLE